MVFNFDRQSLIARVQTRTFRHRPTLEHVAELHAKVVMQMRRIVLLDDIQTLGTGAPPLATRLRRLAKVPFASVFDERHCGFLCSRIRENSDDRSFLRNSHEFRYEAINWLVGPRPIGATTWPVARGGNRPALLAGCERRFAATHP